jgi:hypothetical protein
VVTPPRASLKPARFGIAMHYGAQMVAVLFLFPRFVAAREPLTELVPSLLEGDRDAARRVG